MSYHHINKYTAEIWCTVIILLLTSWHTVASVLGGDVTLCATVNSRTLTLTETSETWSSGFVVLGSFLTSWMSHCALWKKVCRPATPGKVRRCLVLSLFVDNGSHLGSLSPNLRSSFATLSSHLTFCLICYWISFGCGMMCCFLRSFTSFYSGNFLIQHVWQWLCLGVASEI